MVDRDGNWSRLRFEEAVLGAFRFLITEYGFAMIDASSSVVRYEGHGVVVTARQERDSFEVTVTLERKGSGEQFTIWELARLMGAPDVDERTFLQASTAERVERLVPMLADLLKRYGGAALRGDESVFLKLRDQQHYESEQFLREGRLAWVREQAELAWQSRDYSQVVKLLEGVQTDLSAAEMKKLSYARKRMDAT